MFLIVGLALAIVQTQPPKVKAHPTETAKQLSPSARPILSIPGLNPNDILTVSRYTTKESPYPTFVYRYVFRGDMKKVLKDLQTKLTKKDGWRLEWFGEEPCLSRELGKEGKVDGQNVLLHPRRLVTDKHGGHPVKSPDGEQWVWISYNERVRIKK